VQGREGRGVGAEGDHLPVESGHDRGRRPARGPRDVDQAQRAARAEGPDAAVGAGDGVRAPGRRAA
jgi:hypothetical protein